MRDKKVIVTGGAGFIGSEMVRTLVLKQNCDVLTIDKLSYASSLDSLESLKSHSRHRFLQLDLCSHKNLSEAVAEFQPDVVFHFAAESHVDRSISGPKAFVDSNVTGTFNLLEACRSYWKTLAVNLRKKFRFVHVSTDEVFGSLGDSGFFDENSPYQPNSPYSASKAASDHLVRAWFHTYEFPTITSNCSNNFGPFQHPEKLIPQTIARAVAGEPIPVYGKGTNVRDWLFVEDHVQALLLMAQSGVPGEVYCVGCKNERNNLEIVKSICALLNRKLPQRKREDLNSLIEFVADRPGHDFRYAINPAKIQSKLGFAAKSQFELQLEHTIDWYLNNGEWVAQALKRTKGN
jgi:dTDP-glucose 4,6-dehydratase